VNARRRFAASALAALLMAAPLAASAAPSAVTAFVASAVTANPGATITFQIGITSTDTVAWDAASVAALVTISDAAGSPVVTAPPISPGDAVRSGASAIVFADVALPATLAVGNYLARVTVTHAGLPVGTSDPLALTIGSVIATVPPPMTTSPISGSFSTNEQFTSRDAQAGQLAITGKYDGGRTFDTALGLSSTPGQYKPVVNITTSGSTAQIGTFTPSYDSLVFAGATGSGVSYKRSWGAHSIAFSSIAGNNGTPNPFTLDALSYATPLLGAALTATVGDATVAGPVPGGVNAFLTSGDFAGLALVRPANAAGFSYGVRYALIDYEDGVSGTRRTDHAAEGLLGFMIRKSTWTLDFVQASPFYPTVSAPSVTPDKASESLNGTIPLGLVALTVGINGYRDALSGSPDQQKTHFFTETLGLSAPLHNGDTLSAQLSNAAQHLYAVDPLASINDSTGLTYTAKRGGTTYGFTVADTNQYDTRGNLMHTIQDGVTFTRAFGSYLTITGAFSGTGNRAAVSTGTSQLQAFSGTATYTRGIVALTTAITRANTIPFLGTAPIPSTAINYGVVLKPTHAATSLNATVTQNHGASNAAVGSLNLARQF
jgi:hypothetical protein